MPRGRRTRSPARTPPETKSPPSRSVCLQDRTVVGEPHVDHASGYTGNRGPGLRAAIDAAVEVAPSELWVWHTNRLGRGTGRLGEAKAIGHLLYELRAKGVTVRSVEDDEFATNEMLWGFASRQASKYSEDLEAAVKRGKQKALGKGRWPGGPVPDGYRLSVRDAITDKRNLEEDPERAPIIHRAFELRLEGLSFGAIARSLNAEGHRTKPSEARGHDGLPFTATRVRDMLANPVYAARLVLDRTAAEPEIVDGTWPPIVDPPTFDLVGLKVRMRKEHPSKGGRPPTAFALSGLAVCGKCGRPINGRKSAHVRKDGTKQKFYLCAAVAKKTGTCDAPRFDAARIDEAVIHYLGGRFIDFEAWAKEQARTVDEERALIEVELSQRRKELAKLQRQHDTARARYLEDQNDTREEVLGHVRGLVKAAQQRVDEVEGRLVLVQSLPPQDDQMLDVYNKLKQTLQDDTAPLNERLKRLFQKFRIELVVDKGREMIAILPVLRHDAIETDDDGPELMQILDGDNRRLVQVTATERASPVMILVPPPIKGVQVPVIETGSHAWA